MFINDKLTHLSVIVGCVSVIGLPCLLFQRFTSNEHLHKHEAVVHLRCKISLTSGSGDIRSFELEAFKDVNAHNLWSKVRASECVISDLSTGDFRVLCYSFALGSWTHVRNARVQLASKLTNQWRQSNKILTRR